MDSVDAVAGASLLVTMAQSSADHATDTHANGWRLDGDGGVSIRPAGEQTWQQMSPIPQRGWQFLLADRVGTVWIAGPLGLQRFDPHIPAAGWQTPTLSPPQTPVLSLALSPQGLALVGFADGRVIEVDINAAGDTMERLLFTAPEAVRALQVDEDGDFLVETEGGSYRQSAAPDAWQRSWRELARLPGGNHDLFAIGLGGKMWIAGGLTHGLGHPPKLHVFDELLAYDPNTDDWQVVSRMPFRRCYSGIAELEGKLWIVGGAANLSAPDDPDGPREPLADVRIYDPRQDRWSQGPSLGQPRLEPVVVSMNGRIWVIGGTDCDPLRLVQSIGAAETVWRRESELPWPQNQADGCVLDGWIYCMSKDGFLRFDPVAKTWDTDLPQLPESPKAAQVAAFAGKVWVMGGSRRRDTHIYDPVEDTWSTGPDLPTDNSWGAALELQGQLFIAGGAHWSERHQRYFFDDRVLTFRSPNNNMMKE
jgi:N-acetylneuraminic acid mutarotase